MTNSFFLSVFVLKLYLIRLSLTFEYSPIVQTTEGPVKGQVFTTARESKLYYSFRGLRYAEPPIGHLRFANPIKLANERNKEIVLAIEDGVRCPQIINNTFQGTEDCLKLNIYTPQLPEEGKKLKAVMVWIHGGSFIQGEKSKNIFGPDYLIEEDIVVVAINYRLGAPGFLTLEHKDAPGNAGLKDQNLALKWVHENIKNFGGDPKNVTLCGQSAGSSSVGYQILSKKSEGMFHKTISMSGVPICYWSFDTKDEARFKSHDMARKLGFEGDPTKENLFEFYSTVDIKNLTEVVNNYTLVDTPLKPVLEDPKYSLDPFLTECPITKYESGRYNQGPIMMGYTKDEAIVFLGSNDMIQADLKYSVKYLQNLKTDGLINQMYNGQSDHPLNTFIKDINQTQFLSNKNALNKTSTVSKLATIALFKTPIDYTQKKLSMKSNYPIYYYQYGLTYNYSRHHILGVDAVGAGHGDDIPMIFYSNTYRIDPKANNSVTLLQKQMTRMWANMVKYGNPTPNGKKDDLLGIVWPDSRKSGKMLWLDEQLKIHDRYTNLLVDILEYGIQLTGNEYYECRQIFNRNEIGVGGGGGNVLLKRGNY